MRMIIFFFGKSNLRKLRVWKVVTMQEVAHFLHLWYY